MENYTEQDLVKFGNYLLSEERKNNYKGRIKGYTKAERLAVVNDSDLENWKESEKVEG